MDDVSKLGPLWVNQLIKEVASRRNRAAESLLTIKPDGDYAKQHRMLIDATNAMLAGPDLLAALVAILPEAEANFFGGDDAYSKLDAARKAIAKATGETT